MKFAIYQNNEYLIVESDGDTVWLSDQYGKEFPVNQKNIDIIKEVQ